MKSKNFTVTFEVYDEVSKEDAIYWLERALARGKMSTGEITIKETKE